MSLSEAQAQVDQWIKTHGVRYFNELTNMAMLTEEVGEVARIIARKYGEQSSKESDLGKDLGDELAVLLGRGPALGLAVACGSRKRGGETGTLGHRATCCYESQANAAHPLAGKWAHAQTQLRHWVW